MKIAVTGATGFLGRYIVRQLVRENNNLRCWYRPSSDRTGFGDLADAIEWIEGDLGDDTSARSLVNGCDAVVHGALYRPGTGFRGAEGDLPVFVDKNIIGTIRLIEATRAANVGRFVFISTCAVYDRILADRPLDETHPTWSGSHYGAHKAAIENFIHSYGFGTGYPICSLRPTGIYGVAHPASGSKWFDLVRAVAAGETVDCSRGGKEVHAADVAKAASILLSAPSDRIAGQSFNCYDRYVSEWDVANLAKDLAGSKANIEGQQTSPKNQIVTDKIRELGMTFGGNALLHETIREMIAAAKVTIGD